VIDVDPNWVKASGSFRPVLTAYVGAPVTDVVDSMAGYLRKARLRIGYRHERGFRATYRGWWDWLGIVEMDFWRFTRLQVAAEPAPDGVGTHVSVRVEDDGAFRAKRNVAAALTGSFRAFELRGVPVSVSGWTKVPKG
jgi:hypothetical protein